MQTVVDFLIEYYLWILGILVILLITVIGFLADTKRKKKIRAKNEGQNTNNNMNNVVSNDNNMNLGGNVNMNDELNTNNSMNMNNGFNMSGNLNNNMMNQNINAVPDMNVNNMNGFNMDVNSSPVNPSSAAPIESNSFFTPASEQTPTFEPREVTIPTPVEPTPVMNNQTPAVNGWDMPQSAGPAPAVPEVQPAPVAPEVNVSPAPVVQQAPIPEPVVPSVEVPVNNISSVTPSVEVPTNVMPNLNAVPAEPTVQIMGDAPATPVMSSVEVPSLNNQIPNMVNEVPVNNMGISPESTSNVVPNPMPNMGVQPQVNPGVSPVPTPNFITGESQGNQNPGNMNWNV